MDDVAELPVVKGLRLRSLLVLLLLDQHRPMRVPELAAAIRRAGFGVCGRQSKAIADALRWEVAQGRVVRLERGI